MSSRCVFFINKTRTKINIFLNILPYNVVVYDYKLLGKIMADRKMKKEKKKTWWQITLCYLFGLSFVVLPILWYVSLFSYHAEDPSFNKVTDGEVQNVLGTFGSYSADFIFQSFGLALIIFLLVPLFWGYTLLRYQTLAEWKTRIFAWLVGMLCLACFFDLTCRGYLGGFSVPNLAGEWSRSLSRPLNTAINQLNMPYNTLLLEGIILFVAVLSFNFAAGITLKLWVSFIRRMYNLFGCVCQKFVSGGKKLAKIRNFAEFKELNPSYLQSKMPEMNKPKLRIRQEPAFEHGASVVQAHGSIVTANAQTGNDYAVVAKNNNEPAIEIPQASVGNLAIKEEAIPVAKQSNNSFNPTFDFVAEGDIANQNVKKPSKKISPEEIYNTEGKAAAARKKVEQAKADTSAVEPKPAAEEYVLPDINLLSVPQNKAVVYDEATLKANAVKLESVLNDFGIHGKIVKVRPGPVVTLYELEPAPGTRTARVIGLSDDIARSMAVASVRMAVVAGANTIGIELPNAKRETVWLRELFEDETFKNSKNILNVALGKDIGGQHVYADLAKMPHLLVAGTTGSGKSVGVNSMILSLLYRMTPEQCKFIMIDPKQLEFSMYNGIPHLLTPVITDPAKAVVGLKWAVREMEDRYRAMALINVRNIAGYNQKVADMVKSGKEMKKTIQTGFDKETGKPIYEEQIIDTSPMPYIVIVVDEMADLMLVAGKEVEAAIQRLAQMARAAGIHLIMSTQRPSVDVITGTIKSNFPSRISFHVTTKIDSRTILGEQGAEQLLGMGDMLYMPSGMRPVRVHGCFVKDEEVESVVEFVKSQGEPQYVATVTEGELNTKDTPVFDKGEMGAGGDSDDELYRQAVQIVRTDKKASTSYIQRKLRLGYNRAAMLIERMEDEGVVTPPDRVGRRAVIGVEE